MELDGWSASYLGYLADVLSIARPVLETVDMLDTKTMIARYDAGRNVIRLKKSAGRADAAFALAHEMRHAWQAARRRDMLEGYQYNAGNTDKYNGQAAEIDANAFAVIVMTDLYHLRPTFDGLDEETRKRIYARADEIAREWAE
jgi:Zn-dependent peptidase ImmA (M78 family)